MFSLYYLFTELISKEKLKWIKDSLQIFHQEAGVGKQVENITSDSYSLKFFLTGDAIFNLIDKKYLKIITDLLINYEVTVLVDSDELELYGFEYNDLLKNITLKSTLLKSKVQIIDKENFWTHLINIVKIDNKKNKIGFFQFKGPYMSRTSVYATEFIKYALKNQINIDLYTYLDGIHIGHSHQKPSEFENIAKKLKSLKNEAKEKNLDFNMLSCSRCATARGYIKEPATDDFIQSKDTIKGYLICNLNKIVDEFEHNIVIMSPNSASSQFNVLKGSNSPFDKPKNIILITRPPYNSEWSFGAISFAVASATHEIPTNVIFIENGIYNTIGNHKIDEDKKLFNIQEIIAATSDMKFLDYYIYNPSLIKRNLSVHKKIQKSIKKIKKSELGVILYNTNKKKSKYQNRIILF